MIDSNQFNIISYDFKITCMEFSRFTFSQSIPLLSMNEAFLRLCMLFN